MRCDGLPVPDAIFIGGGVTVPGVLDACWARLRDGGRLVANAVTLQGEAALCAWREQHGGELTRIALAQTRNRSADSIRGARLCRSPCCTRRSPDARIHRTPVMRDETPEQPAPLRSGYTTGSCATATRSRPRVCCLREVERASRRSCCRRVSRCRCGWCSAA